MISTLSAFLLPLLLASPTLAADPSIENADADVEAIKVVPVPAEELYARLLDLQNLQAALDCTRKWEFGSRVRDVGASASLVYRIGPFRRKLTMTLSKADENRKVTYDHAGNKGFVTTWTLSQVEDGTKVDVHTYLHLPPWPARRIYLNKIQPEWVACQARAIDRISKSVAE